MPDLIRTPLRVLVNWGTDTTTGITSASYGDITSDLIQLRWSDGAAWRPGDDWPRLERGHGSLTLRGEPGKWSPHGVGAAGPSKANLQGASALRMEVRKQLGAGGFSTSWSTVFEAALDQLQEQPDGAVTGRLQPIKALHDSLSAQLEIAAASLTSPTLGAILSNTATGGNITTRITTAPSPDYSPTGPPTQVRTSRQRLLDALAVWSGAIIWTTKAGAVGFAEETAASGLTTSWEIDNDTIRLGRESSLHASERSGAPPPQMELGTPAAPGGSADAVTTLTVTLPGWDQPASGGSATTNLLDFVPGSRGNVDWQTAAELSALSFTGKMILIGRRILLADQKMPRLTCIARSLPDAVAPAAPAAPTAVVSAQQIVWSWTPGSDGGSTITDYDLEVREGTSGTAVEQLGSTATTATSHTDPGLKWGTIYQARVRATNAIGTGNWSVWSAYAITQPRPPWSGAAPGGMIRWAWPTMSMDVQDLDLEVRETGAAAAEQLGPAATVPAFFNDTGLDASTGYEARMRINGQGQSSPWSPWSAAVTTLAEGAAEITADVSIDAGSDYAEIMSVETDAEGTIRSSVTIKKAATGGFSVTTYKQMMYDDAAPTSSPTSPSWDEKLSYISATEKTVTSESYNKPAGTWTLWVREASQALVVTSASITGEGTFALASPDAPSAPYADTITSSGFTVRWEPPGNGGSAITDYDVRYRAGSSGSWTSVTHTGTALSRAITSLTTATTYQFQVRATNSVGTGSWSASGSVTTS